MPPKTPQNPALPDDHPPAVTGSVAGALVGGGWCLKWLRSFSPVEILMMLICGLLGGQLWVSYEREKLDRAERREERAERAEQRAVEIRSGEAREELMRRHCDGVVRDLTLDRATERREWQAASQLFAVELTRWREMLGPLLKKFSGP